MEVTINVHLFIYLFMKTSKIIQIKKLKAKLNKFEAEESKTKIFEGEHSKAKQNLKQNKAK